MALPSVMKLSHAIHEHQNQKCSKDIAVHFHNAEFDCEFQKFKLSKQFYTDLDHFDFFIPTEIREDVSASYTFLSTYQQLHFSLRGPPSAV